MSDYSATKHWNFHSRFWMLQILTLLSCMVIAGCDPGVSGNGNSNGVGNSNTGNCNGVNNCNMINNTTSASSGTLQTPTTSATDWGVLHGDAISVNQMLTCGDGCPDPLHVEVQTIQIDKGNNTTTFTVHYSASVPNIAAGTVYFPDFSLQSDVTPQTEASQTPINSTQTIIAKFPFAPANNDIYTLAVSAQYQTISSYGTTSITPTTINFEGVQMSFNS